MNTKSISIIIHMIVFVLFSCGNPHLEGFEVKDISDKVFIVSNPDLGNQIVVQSEKGLVIFDSFWSELTASVFKEEIIKISGRDDFSYVINMVDRLDMIGGNGAYQSATIVGHENILTNYSSKNLVEDEIRDLINMWREKEGYSRGRLKNLEAESEEAIKEKNWMNRCITMAYELENSFSLVLPDISYNDKMTLDLGDTKINLFWFGNAGNYEGLTMAVIPGEKLAIISKAIVYPEYHLAPYSHPSYGVLDVSRWIAILEQILECEDPVSNIILSDSHEIYSRELMLSHLEYIRKLWNSVSTLDAESKSLQEIQDQLSLDKGFAFVKEMHLYKNASDNWIRPQHEMHVRLFFLQGKNLASEIIKKGGPESLHTSLKKIENLGGDVYYDEISIDFLGFTWMEMGKINEAIEIYNLNVEAFPESFRVYNSLGSAYMRNGDNENALINFKRSLTLNPENKNTEAMLKKLETK